MTDHMQIIGRCCCPTASIAPSCPVHGRACSNHEAKLLRDPFTRLYGVECSCGWRYTGLFPMDKWNDHAGAIPNHVQEEPPCTATTDERSVGTRTTESSSATDADGHPSAASSSGSEGHATPNLVAEADYLLKEINRMRRVLLDEDLWDDFCRAYAAKYGAFRG